MEFTPLTDAQRALFDRDGFLVVPDAIPPELVKRLREASDCLYQEGLATHGLNARGFWDLRNCLPRDENFLELLDWSMTVPLVVQLLGHNLQLITSHLIMRPSNPPDTDETYRASGWHRDGGTAPSDLGATHPRMFIKIGYWLSDARQVGRGTIRFIPGSHNWSGRMPELKEGCDPDDVVEMQVEPGTAVLFENRTLHAVGPNLSDITRKTLFFGYGYRWLRPMDYVAMPEEMLAGCDPIRRQLLGDCTSPMGYQLPEAEDVPLRAWLQEHGESDLDPTAETPGRFASTGRGR